MTACGLQSRRNRKMKINIVMLAKARLLVTLDLPNLFLVDKNIVRGPDGDGGYPKGAVNSKL